MSMKNPLTPAGIEPATFLIVAQHLNRCATAVPLFSKERDDFFPRNQYIFKFLYPSLSLSLFFLLCQFSTLVYCQNADLNI